MNKTYITILIFLFSGEFIYSSVQDSLNHNSDSSTISFFYQDNRVFGKRYAYSDTSLNKFQSVLPLDFRGGIVSPNEKYTIEQQSIRPGFNLGLNNFDRFDFCLDSVRFFKTRTPYTDLKLIFSSKKEQYFKLLHTQNFNKNWNFAFQLIRTNGEGFYLRQNAVSNNASISSNYLSGNNRYALQIAGISKNFKKDENGGIANDSIFESNIFADKKLFGVNLSDARTRRGNHEIYLKQFLFLGPSEEIRHGDSIRYKRVIPKSYVSHSIHYSESWFVYSDKTPRSGFYENIFLDSNATLDSIHLTKIENQVNVGTLDNSKIGLLKNINFELGIKQQFIKVNQLKRDSIFNDLIVTGSLFNKYLEGDNNHFLINGNYFFAGDHMGNYAIAGEAGSYFKKKKTKLTVSAFIKYSSPDYVYTKYNSNNFQWYNNFANVSEKNIRFLIQDQSNKAVKVSAGLNYNSIFNFVYFDSTFLPKQLPENLNVLSATVNGDLDFKHWHFHNRIIYQKAGGDDIFQGKILPKIPDREHVLRIPGTVGFQSFYYSGKWFKKVMDVQIGADVFYFSSYYADAYMPALGMFYIQNKKQIGDYPFLDFFFNFKIKRARIFLKVEHFASGLLGSNYYIAPHYPGNDRQIRFGISWKFFD